MIQYLKIRTSRTRYHITSIGQETLRKTIQFVLCGSLMSSDIILKHSVICNLILQAYLVCNLNQSNPHSLFVSSIYPASSTFGCSWVWLLVLWCLHMLYSFMRMTLTGRVKLLATCSMLEQGILRCFSYLLLLVCCWLCAINTNWT